MIMSTRLCRKANTRKILSKINRFFYYLIKSTKKLSDDFFTNKSDSVLTAHPSNVSSTNLLMLAISIGTKIHKIDCSHIVS